MSIKDNQDWLTSFGKPVISREDSRDNTPDNVSQFTCSLTMCSKSQSQEQITPQSFSMFRQLQKMTEKLAVIDYISEIIENRIQCMNRVFEQFMYDELRDQ